MTLPIGPRTHSSRVDLALASTCWGFTLGFGFLVTWGAIKQTMKTARPTRSVYIILVWIELFASFMYGFLSYLVLTETLEVTFGLLFAILFVWSLQVQCLLQIIINRLNVILPEQPLRRYLKWAVALLWLTINISGFIIWLPARLGISEKWTYINYIWDRCDKTIYLVVDCGLNCWFIRLVRVRLIEQGLVKYEKLAKFNTRIIFISLAMDALLLGTMNLKNDLVYMQVAPLAFTVKLNIEMTMANLIRKLVNEKKSIELSHTGDFVDPKLGSYNMTITGGRASNHEDHLGSGDIASVVRPEDRQCELERGIMVHRRVVVEHESVREEDDGSMMGVEHSQEDEYPLRHGA